MGTDIKAPPTGTQTADLRWSPAPADEIDLFEYIVVLYRAKWLVILFSLVFSVAAFGLSYLMTPKYEASITLVPTTGDASPLSSLAGKLGSLAALAGLSGPASQSLTEEALAVLKSRAFTMGFIEDKDLLPVLFANKWDAEAKAWKDADPEEIPSLLDGYRKFEKKVRSIARDERSGYVTLTILWKDPAVAAAWANEMVALLNSRMREDVITAADRNRAYLEEQLKQANVVEVRQALYGLIEAQLNNAMLAKTRDDFVFKVVDPAVTKDPEDFDEPNRLLMVAVGIFFGGILGVIAALVRHAIRERRGSI